MTDRATRDRLEKEERLFQWEGCQVWSTEDPKLAILEWEEERVGRLAFQLCQVLKQHALLTSLVERRSDTQMLIRRSEPVRFYVVGHAAHHEATASFYTWDGQELTPKALLQLPSMSKSTREYVKDCAIHSARTLRARLRPHNEAEVRLRLDFGLTYDHDLTLQVLNPLLCDFPDSDYDLLCEQLGGDRH